MPPLHLSPETAHQTAALLQRQAGAFFEAVHALRRDLARLQVAWRGGQSDAFQSQGQTLLQALETQTEALDLLARRLESEIQEWEAVDRQGADALRGLFRSRAWGPALPLTGGAFLTAASASWPLFAVFSLGRWLSGLPAWLDSWLKRLFPPEPILSPLPPEAEIPKGRLTETLRRGFARLEQKGASSSGRVIDRLTIEEVPASSAASVKHASEAASITPSYGYNVPLYSQQGLKYNNQTTAFGCVPTAVSMVMSYWHNQDSKHATRSPQELLDLNVKQGEFSSTGMSPSKILEDVEQLGYKYVTAKTSASWEELREEVAKGPVIAVVKLGMQTTGTNHAVVVTGISQDGSKVLVNDPWDGRAHGYDAKTFRDSWGAVETPNSYVSIRP